MSQIFNADNCPNWWCLLLLMFISFLLGWILSKWFTKRFYQEKLDDCNDENRKLKASIDGHKDTMHANTTFDAPQKIKAVKTMERSGKAVSKSELDFASFGKATEADKDDLKKISGVGPFIEKKLNSIGIYTFDQISKFKDTDIETVTQLIEFFPGRILRDDWRGQAEVLKNGGETDFSKRVDNKDVDYDDDNDDK